VSDSHDAPLMHHEYDGIQEHDNPTPRWFMGIFLGCIAFAAAYLGYYWIAGLGGTREESFQHEWAEYEADRKAALATEVIDVSEDTLKAAALDPDTVAHGHQVFVEKCTGCHTDNGRGLVGPNLTDTFQIHGATRMDIFNTVTQGVVEKGMVAWGEVLPQHDILAVAAFVTTLRGTNVPGGKPPQGEKVGAFTP
jgi:cytochrome c oxidase cbb3-type subunit 3